MVYLFLFAGLIVYEKCILLLSGSVFETRHLVYLIVVNFDVTRTLYDVFSFSRVMLNLYRFIRFSSLVFNDFMAIFIMVLNKSAIVFDIHGLARLC